MKRLLSSVSIATLGCAVTAVSPLTSAESAAPAQHKDRPTVGAIRWDGWNEWAYYEKCFDPPEWRYRLPFFATITPANTARVREDSQEVIDKEIAYAKAGGLDYWAFLYYHPVRRSWATGRWSISSR